MNETKQNRYVWVCILANQCAILCVESSKQTARNDVIQFIVKFINYQRKQTNTTEKKENQEIQLNLLKFVCRMFAGVRLVRNSDVFIFFLSRFSSHDSRFWCACK